MDQIDPVVIHNRSHSLVGPSSYVSHSLKLNKLTIHDTEDSVDLVECLHEDTIKESPEPFIGDRIVGQPLEIVEENFVKIESVGIEDFEVLKVVGQGAFAKVYQVRKKGTSEIYAMKVMRKDKIDLATCPLRSVPVWALHCNGRKLGFAARRKAGDKVRLMLKTMQSTTVGAGALPSGFGFGSEKSEDQVMYMRANYEHVVGSADSESFHLINPDQCPGQELSVFLLRSRNSL